jgi:hypothetical protein
MFAPIIPYYRSLLCLLLAVCLLSACLAPPQPQCKLSHAPDVRGLRLRMTLEDFKERFAATGEPAPLLSSSAIDLTPNPEGVVVVPTESRTVSDGVKVYKLERDGAYVDQLLFVDGRVAHFRVVYENYTDQFAWEDVDQFAGKMSDSLNLPDAWQPKDSLHLESNREVYKAWDVLDHSARLYTAHWGIGNLEQMFLLCDETLVSVGVPSPGKRHWTNGAFIQFDDLAALSTLRVRIGTRQFEEERKERERREGFKP